MPKQESGSSSVGALWNLVRARVLQTFDAICKVDDSHRVLLLYL